MKRNVNPRGARGFTLVELLVVMAIIAILASIVVPNVAKYITQSRMTNALSEVKNAETAFTGMLAAAQVSNFRDFFDKDLGPWPAIAGLANPAEQVWQAQQVYTEAFYLLLRYGKDAATHASADLGFNMNVIRKLGSSSMEIDKDPWGNLYQVYAGPWRVPSGDTGVWNKKIPPFRVRSLDPTIPGNSSRTITAGDEPILNDGDPDTPDVTYTAPTDLPIYIYSMGQDKQPGQSLFGSLGGYMSWNETTQQLEPITDRLMIGGGDDISNWDTEQSYDELY